MKAYIGTKELNAKPMTKSEYCLLRGWVVPIDEKPDAHGFLVEYKDGGKPNVESFNGYVSWSPSGVFESSYRSTDRMTFGDAIFMLKKGIRVARTGWNGKGLWLELQVPDAHSKMTLPYIYINYPTDAQNTPGARVPWLASQTDMLADDWTVM